VCLRRMILGKGWSVHTESGREDPQSTKENEMVGRRGSKGWRVYFLKFEKGSILYDEGSCFTRTPPTRTLARTRGLLLAEDHGNNPPQRKWGKSLFFFFGKRREKVITGGGERLRKQRSVESGYVM